MKVLVTAAECAPFAQTGGLGDVVGALPRALRRRGLDVRVLLPLYAGMPWHEMEVLEGPLGVPLGSGLVACGLRLHRLPDSDVPVYFVEHHRLYDRPHLYGPPDLAYGDNLERFALLSRSALELCRALGWIPDVIHANDWHTALVPVYLRALGAGNALAGSASVYAIHNLAYQGVFDRGSWWITGLAQDPAAAGAVQGDGALNLTRGALTSATRLVTVSARYAGEIQAAGQGRGLEDLLRRRSPDLRGILNGIDVHDWSPARDPALPAPFDGEDLRGKQQCKAALQRDLELPERAAVPLFVFIGRLVPQKGIDLLAQALPGLLDRDVQFALLGSGSAHTEGPLLQVARQYPGRMRVLLRFDPALARRLLAGADFLVMPSRFEPCGLNQMYALRYGTIPVVHATGGLADTVANLDAARGTGTGFVLYDLDAHSLYRTLVWAADTWFHQPEQIAALRRRGMQQDFSMERTAADYEALYREAVHAHRSGARGPAG